MNPKTCQKESQDIIDKVQQSMNKKLFKSHYYKSHKIKAKLTHMSPIQYRIYIG